MMQNSRYIQYGCGFSAPAEWRNFDSSPTLRFERMPLVGNLYSRNDQRFPTNVEYGDIVKGLPVPNQSCQVVYCSHVLEHLALEDFRLALRHTRKILKAGGLFRLVVPDLEYFIAEYQDCAQPNAAMTFMENTYLGRKRRLRGLKGILLAYLGNSNHLWMWDFNSMSIELKAAGFADIRRAEMGDSEEEMFKLVEDEGRWVNCLGVECRAV